MPDWWDPQILSSWLHALGTWAWPAFLGLQVAQVLVFWIPGEAVQIVGGMVFGVWPGTALSLVGIATGGLVAFFCARSLGKPWVERWLATQGFSALQAVAHHRRLDLVLGVVFLLPFLPKDIFCYLAGLSNLKPWRFFWVTTLARIPSLLLSSWMGDLAVHGLGLVLVVVMALSTVLGIALVVFRRSLLALLVR